VVTELLDKIKEADETANNLTEVITHQKRTSYLRPK
jgi:hypothetical protein